MVTFQEVPLISNMQKLVLYETKAVSYFYIFSIDVYFRLFIVYSNAL